MTLAFSIMADYYLKAAYELRRNALQAGFAADNLEEMFLSMIDNDNTTRKQRAKL